LARAMPSLTAASNPSEEVALISVTVATLMSGSPFDGLHFSITLPDATSD
jgi:hypothetical protein